MRDKGKSSTGVTRRAGAPWRRRGTTSRQRAAYAASVDHVQGLMAWRIY